MNPGLSDPHWLVSYSETRSQSPESIVERLVRFLRGLPEKQRQAVLDCMGPSGDECPLPLETR